MGMLSNCTPKSYAYQFTVVAMTCTRLAQDQTNQNSNTWGRGKGHWGSILREGNTGSRWYLKEGESLSFSGMTSGQFPLFQGWSLTHVHMGSTNWTQGCIIFSFRKKKEGVKLGVRWGGGHSGRWMDTIKIHCIIYEHFKQYVSKKFYGWGKGRQTTPPCLTSCRRNRLP